MQSKTKNGVHFHYSGRRFLYTLCFLMFCVIDQRIKTCSGLDGWLETFRDLFGTVVAIIILSHCKADDFRRYKAVYIAWNLLGIAAGLLFCLFGQNAAHFLNGRISIALGGWLFGNVLIHTFLDRVVEKKKLRFNKKFMGIWLAMMALMILSRNGTIWPAVYFVIFGCFYLTDFEREEQEDLLQGMLDGIILGFFLMQGWCFVFRPYDAARYVGVYSNSNLNALFYLEVLAAVFAKIVYITQKGFGKWLKLFYWLGAGALYAFIFLTIGRIAWITSVVLGLCFLWAMAVIGQKKKFLKQGCALVLSFCLMFPAVFGAVRYLPPVFHHPVWFWGEWHEEKVHSWDAWDSEKYVDLDVFLESALGRIADSAKTMWEHSPFAMKVHAATAEERYAEMLEQGYALTQEELEDFIAVRGSIYRYYFQHLNLFGHPYEEQGFQIYPTYWIGHAHNLFLQFGTDFGIVVMALLVVLMAGAVISLRNAFVKTRSVQKFASLLFLLVIMVFGLAEYSWGTGSLSLMLMFLAWKDVLVEQ